MSACWFIAHSIHVCNITWTYANSIFCPRKAFIVIRVFGQKKNDLHIHLQGFRGFFGNFFCLSFCSFSYVLAPVIDLLLVMLPIQKLQRKHHWDRQFLLPWSRQLCAYISGCIKPITLIWVSLERSCVPADVGYRWYPFWSQVNGQLQATQESMGPTCILKTPFGLSFMCFQGADKFYFFRTGWILQRYKIYHFWLIQPRIKCKCKCLQVPDKLQNN